MITGRITGSVVASIKDRTMEGVPLLTVKLIENSKEKGTVVAADHTRQAGIGDFVYLIPKKEASRIFRDNPGPFDMAVVGFIDTYNEEL